MHLSPKHLAPLVGCLVLVACAPTVWDKPGITQGQFNQDNARCRLVARGMNSGDFYAEGKPAFVAGAAIGNAVGAAINTAATYHDCMMAEGYTPQNPSVSGTNDPALRTRINAIVEELKNCFSSVRSKPPYNILSSHLRVLGAPSYTMAQLADERLPSQAEIHALIPYIDEGAQCKAKPDYA
jgi:hypothetical protein